ncbi:hypothetical protein K8R04_04275 [Candidatus Uhrbacteria bacterium]|nr:hypothetical protein [Candidatus Uhrbacteria bacterium]
MDTIALMLMIEEEIGNVVPEGTEPLIDLESSLFTFPKIEDETPLFEVLEPGSA